MTRKLKRPIALLLSVAMLVTMMFTGAFALTASAATITPSAPTGNGTADSPYQIGTAAELYWFAGLVNGDSSVCDYNADTNPSGIQKNASACAILTNSITLNEGLLGADGEPSIESPEAWTPISQFKGEFDGQDYTVSGLYINKPSDSSIGMFTSVSFGKVSNLNIADSYFFGDESVGGIAGYSKYSTIDNCSFSGTIKGINFIGGIVGNVDNDSVIKNCTFSGIVDGERRVGGIAGRSSSDQGSKSFTIIRHCTVNGKVLGEEYIGGICGQLIVFDGVGSIAGGVGARVSYCENNADVKSFVVISSISLDYLGGKVGGIVGHAYKSTVETSSNNGSVIANYECCGGVVGYLQNAVISDCYNGGYVKYEKRIADEINPLCDSFGGIVGALWGTVKNCYADGKVSGSSGDNGGSLFGEPNSEITVSNCYALKGIRQTPDGTVLSDQFDTYGSAYSEGGCEFVDDSVVGTGELAYKLGAAWGQEFNYLNVIGEKPVVGGARVFNANYKNNSIENDYHNHNASGYSASCLICYGASVDNDKHKPTTDENGVYQISTAEELCWFAYNSKTSTASADAVLTNDIAINSNVLNEDGTLAVDASNLIMWDPMGCYATNGSIPSSQSYTGNFDGQGYTVSGLFFEDTNTDGRCCVGFFSRIGAGGSVKNLNITDSYFVANSSYGYVGGICGLNEGAIDNCTFSGVVTGQKYVGGICSTKTDSTADITISNCTNYGKISGESAVGGICGVAGKRVTITNCSNKIGDNAKIGSTDSGEITAGYGTVGGICGNSCGKIIECYNEGTVKGPNRVGGIVGSFSMTAKVEKCVNTRAKYPMELDSNYSPKYSGPISGDRFVGGICGSTDSIFGGVIKSCYNLNQQVCGTVANETSIGGLVGCCYSKAVIEGCFNYCTDFTKDNAVMTANTPKNYYLFGKVENNCTLNNNYYYIESLTEDCDNQASGTAFATKAQFASGEVAYFTKLGQNIDSDSDYPKLDYPTIDGPQVYQNKLAGYTCEYSSFTEWEFSNTEVIPTDYQAHKDDDSDGYCDYCENIMSANLTLSVPKDGEAMPIAFASLPDGIAVSNFAVDSEDTTADYNKTYTVTANVSAVGKVFLNTPTFSINGTAVTAAKNENGSYAVSFEFKPTVDLTVTAKMVNGASIRLTNGNGLRFYTVVDSAKIAELQALGATVELGTLIAPKDVLGEDDLTFNSSKYIDVKYEAIENGAYYWHKDVDGQIAGSIINIKESNTSFSTENGNIARDFVGRGYVKVTLNGTTVITYADYADGDVANNTRSLAYVANALKNDTAKYGELDNDTKSLVDNWASKLTNE